MEWHCIDNELPEENKKILVYSPIYKIVKNEPMVFRIIDSQFLKHMRDVKYWAYIDAPDENTDTTL